MDEVRKFAENTSVKGVSRCMKATTLPIRILWLVSVLGLLYVSFTQTICLVQQYLQYSTVIDIEEINGFNEYHKYKEMFALPDVTVCNQNPLTAYSGYTGITWKDYIEMVSSISSENIEGKHRAPKGYVEYLGPQAVVNDSSKHKFIIDCVYRHTLKRKKYHECRNATTLRYFPSAIYGQCYTVSLNKRRPMELLLTLYLGEVNAPMMPYVAENRASQGVTVAIHEHRTMPILDYANFASAGKLTSFNVKKTFYKRLQDSSDPCRENGTKDSGIQDFLGQQYAYSQMGCLHKVQQTAVLEACHCIHSDLSVLPTNQTLEEVHFCGATNTNVTQETETENDCVQNITRSTWRKVRQSCTVPCNETYHSVTVSSSSWPAIAAQLSFYEHYIRNESYAEHFAVYENIYTNFLNTSDEQRAKSELAKCSLIEKNFAKIEIVPEIRGELYKVAYQISLCSLVASIGGNLNLWSGISAVIIIEVLDLFIKLIQAHLRKHPPKPASCSPHRDESTPRNHPTKAHLPPRMDDGEMVG